jgi:hypothetical protein
MAERDERMIARIKAGIVLCLSEADSSYAELWHVYRAQGGEAIDLPFVQAWFDLLGEGRIEGDAYHTRLAEREEG